jgi:excisionase family DNA binding protein
MQAATLTVEQAGQTLGICRNAAYSAVKAGEIPSIRIGRRVLVPKVAFERMLAEAGQQPSKPEKAA